MMNLAILFGGVSNEHEISLLSAAAVLRNPVNKRDSLEDFLKLREKIDELGIPV